MKRFTTKASIWLALLLGTCLLGLMGCPTGPPLTHIKLPPPGPEEKVYRLSVGNELQVPITDNEAMVYRFDAQVQQDGLYQFETIGGVDTLCALVQGTGTKEEFVVVRDLGGRGENCRLMWAFSPGVHRIKVRVDGRGSFRAVLRRLSWGQRVTKKLQRDKVYKDTLNDTKDLHTFRFTLKASRLVQLQARGKGLLQCILRQQDGRWLGTQAFRQPYGSCSIGQQLPAGSYRFELRGDRPRTTYGLLFQQIRMQALPASKMKEGYLQGSTFDVYRLKLSGKRRHLIQTHGKSKLRCTLEDRLGHVVIPHRTAADGRNCSFDGQFAPGKYFLRVRLSPRAKTKGGALYLASFREQVYTALSQKAEQEITPDFQAPFQLYKLSIPTDQLYQIEVSGRPIKCSLRSTNQRSVSLMDLSEPDRCVLFANFRAGGYFLQIVPTTRDELPYKLKIVPYKAPKGAFLSDGRPRLIGPVYPSYKRVFKIRSTQPQLVMFETRGKLDTICTLFDASGRKLIRDDDSGKKLNCQLTRYLKPGNYHLRVHIGGRRSGLFWVQRSRKKLPWLQLGKTTVGEVTGPKRPQTFMLRIKRTGLYGIRTESKLDTICKMLDNDWRPIAKDDDSGMNKNCFLAQLMTPGVYPIQVELYRNQRGKFRLIAEELSLKKLEAGKTQRGDLDAPHWTSFYRVEVKSPGLYVMRTNGKLDTRCQLLNEQSKRIAKNDDANSSDKNCEMITNLQAGVYFFQIWLYKHARRRSKGPLSFEAVFDVKKAPIYQLPQGKYVDGTLKPNGITRYIFEVKKTGRYRFETLSGLDPKCTLLHRSLRVITRDDDSGLGRNCRIERQLKKGTYELQVRPATTARNRGPYRVGAFWRGK